MNPICRFKRNSTAVVASARRSIVATFTILAFSYKYEAKYPLSNLETSIALIVFSTYQSKRFPLLS